MTEEMDLRTLRKLVAGKTQRALAQALGVGQDAVSRVERQDDLMLSTLDLYLRALGGRLRLVAEFEDRAPITIAKPGGEKGRLTGRGQDEWAWLETVIGPVDEDFERGALTEPGEQERTGLDELFR